MSTLEDLLAHQRACNERLYLVASENSLGLNARLAFLTDVLNRYYFPLNEYRHWAFPGNEFIERIYERCRASLRELTGAKFVNLRPISGVNAMTIALASLAKSGDTIATIAPENGGHAITAGIARRLGLKVVHLPYRQDEFLVDTALLSNVIEQEKVSLIYLDQCHILFPINLHDIRAAVPESIKIYYDGSHVMGLIFGKNFQEPLAEGAAFLGGSTHKTIPGPHKGFIATNDEEAHERIKRTSSVFVSHDHGADVAALAVVLEEMSGRWQSYSAQVIKNAQYLANAMDARGFTLAAKEQGFTKSHQLWIDIAPLQDPFEAVLALARCNIIINTIRAPSIAAPLALRLGVQELTHAGAGEDHMGEIADIFADVLLAKRSSEEDIKARVRAVKQSIPSPFDATYLARLLEALGIHDLPH